MDDEKELVLFDCDCTLGLPIHDIDDGLALLYLLGREDINLLGVTTTFGNGTAPQACTQTRKLLDRFGGSAIPVYEGANGPAQMPTPASRFLAETVAAHPGQVTVLATGPLGNLRSAARFSPRFFSQVKRLLIMGGNLNDPKIGWRHLPDLNFAKDPLAAHTVLHAPCDRTIFHMNICLQAPFKWRDLAHIAHWPSDLRRIVRGWLLLFGAYCAVSEFYLWDLLPAVCISYPELFESNPVKIVSTEADLRKGRLLLGDEGSPANLPSRILDQSKLMDILFTAWNKTVARG